MIFEFSFINWPILILSLLQISRASIEIKVLIAIQTPVAVFAAKLSCIAKCWSIVIIGLMEAKKFEQDWFLLAQAALRAPPEVAFQCVAGHCYYHRSVSFFFSLFSPSLAFDPLRGISRV